MAPFRRHRAQPASRVSEQSCPQGSSRIRIVGSLTRRAPAPPSAPSRLRADAVGIGEPGEAEEPRDIIDSLREMVRPG